jgi:MFS family permease
LHNQTSPVRTAGAIQALGLILALALPVIPLIALLPNLPQLFRHFAAVPHAEFLVPLIITIPSVLIAVLSPISGLIADCLGRRRLLVIASLVFCIFGTLPVLLNSLYAVLASLFVAGAADAFIMTCGNALLGDYFPPEPRKRWLGVQASLGAVLSTLVMLSGGLLGGISWHDPFLLNLIGGIVFVWLLLYTWEPPVASGQRGPDSAADLPAKFAWRTMLPLYAASLFCGLFYYFQIELGMFFAQLGVHRPFQLSVITTIASVGVIGGGWYIHQQRSRGVAFNIALIFVCYGVGFLGMGLAGGYLVALPFALIAQAGNGMFIPVFVGWALGRLAPAYRGRGMGLWMTSFFSAQFLAPAVLTLVARSQGNSVLGALVLAGGASLIVALITAARARAIPAQAQSC